MNDSCGFYNQAFILLEPLSKKVKHVFILNVINCSQRFAALLNCSKMLLLIDNRAFWKVENKVIEG